MKHKKIVIYTIGHSTRTFEELLEILQAYSIKQIIDVRTIPRSRTNPQFNSADFAHALKKEHISYIHMANLGGLRHAHKDSINTAWHNASFRGYADYMQTPAFADALQELIEYGREKTSVIMCAEAVPWRCHRSLIGDALVVKGIQVMDIFSKTNAKEHVLTAWAKIKDDIVYYPEDAL